MLYYTNKMEPTQGTLTKIFFIDEITGNGIFLVDPGDGSLVKWVGRCNMKPDIGDLLITRENLEIVRHAKYGLQYKAQFIEVDYPVMPRYIKTKLVKIFGRNCGLIENKNIWDQLRSKSPTIPNKLCAKFEEYQATRNTLVKGLGLFLFEKRLEWPRRIIFDVENAIPDIENILRIDLGEGLLRLANCHEFPSDKFSLLYDIPNDVEIRLKMIEVARKYEDDGGHTIMPYDLFYERCKLKQGIMGVRAYLRKYADFTRIGDKIARTYINDMEKYIAESLIDLASMPPQEFIYEQGKLSPTQESAIKMMVSNKISIIMGAAGTGKSTVLLRMVKTGHRIHILAPTGKAVSRLREGGGKAAAEIMTVHRWNLMQNIIADTPKFIFIDESSMLDIPTFYKFLRNMPEDAHICLIGDPYQLPSVGIGCVFLNIIENFPMVPRVELDTVFRQENDSGLMTAVNSIRNGSVPAAIDDFFIEANTQSEIENALLKVMEDDAMIITPLNSTVRRLTPLIRNKINPNAVDDAWTIGDRVIQTVNIAQQDRYNGITGVITSILPTGGYKVRFCTGEDHTYNKMEAENELSLAYVLTVHKAQGSEADNVIIVLPTNPDCRLLTNRLIYTAISRAKKYVKVIGSRQVFRRMVKTREPLRQTALLSK